MTTSAAPLLSVRELSVASCQVLFKGENLIPLSEAKMRRVRGDDISIIFQEPMTSLNPLHTIEKQITEILALHRGITGAAARARVIELLTRAALRSRKAGSGAIRTSSRAASANAS